MINHVVLFKTKKVQQNLVDLMEKEFFDLKNKIPEIKAISGGNNCSSEGLSKDFSKGYLLSFENQQELQKYLDSEEHRNFVVNYVNPVVEDVIVFDYIYSN
jgi:hypothetical protein